jgi:hypothetical protein
MISSLLATASSFDSTTYAPEAYPSWRTIVLILTATLLPMLAAMVVVIWAVLAKRKVVVAAPPVSANYKIERLIVHGPRCQACDKAFVDDDLVLALEGRPLAHARCLAVEANKRPGKATALPLPRTDDEPSRPSSERVV